MRICLDKNKWEMFILICVLLFREYSGLLLPSSIVCNANSTEHVCLLNTISELKGEIEILSSRLSTIEKGKLLLEIIYES